MPFVIASLLARSCTYTYLYPLGNMQTIGSMSGDCLTSCCRNFALPIPYQFSHSRLNIALVSPVRYC